MKGRVHLLYRRDCPNVGAARENLRLAMRGAGLLVSWTDVDLGGASVPARWRGFPSPSVLIDGTDVATGKASSEGGASCRFAGAPSAESIGARLKDALDGSGKAN